MEIFREKKFELNFISSAVTFFFVVQIESRKFI